MLKAVQTALQKLKNGGTVDGAKALCSPEMLCQIPLWKVWTVLMSFFYLHGICSWQLMMIFFGKKGALHEIHSLRVVWLNFVNRDIPCFCFIVYASFG